MAKWWMAIALAMLIFLVLIYVVGAQPPANHRVVVRRMVNVEIAQVYQRISDFESFPKWRSGLTKVEIKTRKPTPIYAEHTGSEQVEYELVELQPLKRLHTRIVSKDLPYSGEWVIALQGEASQTTVEIEEVGKVPNPIFRFLSHYFFGHTTSINTYLNDLQESFEN